MRGEGRYTSQELEELARIDDLSDAEEQERAGLAFAGGVEGTKRPRDRVQAGEGKFRQVRS